MKNWLSVYTALFVLPTVVLVQEHTPMFDRSKPMTECDAAFAVFPAGSALASGSTAITLREWARLGVDRLAA